LAPFGCVYLGEPGCAVLDRVVTFICETTPMSSGMAVAAAVTNTWTNVPSATLTMASRLCALGNGCHSLKDVL
jgi:hypothetical protein